MVILLVFLLILNIAIAADIGGTIYDLNLDKVDKVLVMIDTNPKQSFVTVNGSYSFYVPEGRYTIKANLIEHNFSIASASYNVDVTGDGNFIVDLVLLPDFAEELSLIDESAEIDISEDIFDNGNVVWPYFLAVGLIIIVLVLIFYKKKRPKQEPKEVKVTISDDEKQVIRVISDNGNRITQKDLRKNLALSETKISLVLADLEDKGKIRKIKKGRGNILILNRK